VLADGIHLLDKIINSLQGSTENLLSICKELCLRENEEWTLPSLFVRMGLNLESSLYFINKECY